MEKKKPILYLIPNNHFDLSWRRPFRKDMVFENRNYVSYSKIEEFYILDNMSLCDKYPEYKFSIESVAVVREFLRRRPDMKDRLFNLAREGRVSIPGSGDAIIDSNMVLGETLVRNFSMGISWSEENFGQKNRQAFRADAFGNSAQLRQIFRGCGLTHAFAFTYVLPNGKYWRGLDGSTVSVSYPKNVGNGGNPYKLEPCPECKGFGKSDGKECESCHGRGINVFKEQKIARPFYLNEEALERYGVGYIHLAPEECLPKAGIIEQAREISDKYDVRFVNPEEPLSHVEDDIKKTDSVCLANLHGSAELNPTSTGCYVTRIKSKQVLRQQEYGMLSAETLSVMSMLNGNSYPTEKTENIWHELFFTAFHDCVTATVVDPAYDELEEVRAYIGNEISELKTDALKLLAEKAEGNKVTVINPFGVKKTEVVYITLPEVMDGVKISDSCGKELTVVSVTKNEKDTTVGVIVENLMPYSTAVLEYCEADRKTENKPERDYIENSRYKIEFDENGIVSIFDKKMEKIISKEGEYRPAELIMEHDEGSPWTTHSCDKRRYRMRDHTKLVSTCFAENTESVTFKTYFGIWYSQKDVNAFTTVTLTEGIDRIDFKTTVDWDTFSHRLRIAFPSVIRGKNMYDIPYGMIERKEYTQSYYLNACDSTFDHRNDPDGDYPAINWAGVDSGSELFAVFNKGTPSYKVEQDINGGSTVLLSVLRSPNIPTYLHEPSYYTMTDWDGMRDVGHHEFEYAVASYEASSFDSSVFEDAYNFNTSLIPVNGCLKLTELPALASDNAYISSVKPSIDGQGIVVRIAEYRGMASEPEITLPSWASSVSSVNMLERDEKTLDISGGNAQFELRPFEIKTLLFKMK